MSNIHPRRISVEMHLIDLLDGDIKPLYSALYRAGLTAGSLAAAKLGRMIRENVSEMQLPDERPEFVCPQEE